MKRVIINADDLGICEGTNAAINRAHRDGVLTSASLMANGAAFDHAVESVIRPNPDLGVGLHLCLTSGPSVCAAKEIPLLVDERGCFRHGFASLVKLLWQQPRPAREQIQRELTAQFQHLAAAGIEIDHVNGHRHFHMIPPIFEIVADLARQHSALPIRVSAEPLPRAAQWCTAACAKTFARNLPKRMILSYFARRSRAIANVLPTTNATYGIMGSGGIYGPILAGHLRTLPTGFSEILTHPGIEAPEVSASLDHGDIAFLKSPDRLRELQALTDDQLPPLIETAGLTLARFSDIKADAEESAPPSISTPRTAVAAADEVTPQNHQGTPGSNFS